MKHSINAYIYVVTDSFGNIDEVVTNEQSNTVQIFGMVKENGDPVFFESEAYSIDGWASTNGFKCVSEEITIFVEI